MQQSSFSHLKEFSGLGMGQTALLCLKKQKPLDVTAKGMMWCDHCDLGKLRATESLKGEEVGLSADHAQERAKSQSSPSWSPLLLGVLSPNMFLYGKFGLTSARLMHLRNPAFSTDLCGLLLKQAPHLFHLCQ